VQPNQPGIFHLTCDVSCPNQTVSDVVWNVHLLSQSYNIALSCRNNNCTSRNEQTRLLQLEQQFTIDSNNSLNFHFFNIYHSSLMGCVVTTGDCLETSYWTVQGGTLP